MDVEPLENVGFESQGEVRNEGSAWRVETGLGVPVRDEEARCSDLA